MESHIKRYVKPMIAMCLRDEKVLLKRHW